MDINPHLLTKTEHDLRIIFDTAYGRGIGYWMSGAIDVSKQYSVEWTIDDQWTAGQNLFSTDERTYRISIHDQSNHIQGRIIKYQDTDVLEIGKTTIMLGDIDQGYDNQWVEIIVPAIRLKLYDCNY